MNKLWMVGLLVGLLAAFPLAAQAQGPSLLEGFTVEGTALMIAAFIPADLGPPGGGGAPQARGGVPQAPGGGGQGGAVWTGGAEAAGGGETRFRIVDLAIKDEKLYLTRGQVERLLPILQDMKQSVFPSPSKARKLQAAIDEVLTREQKAAWQKLVAEMDKARQSAQAQGGTGGERQDGERQDGERQDGERQGGARQQLGPEELKLRILEGVIARLERWREQGAR
jgi:hypothetical protein